MRLELEDQIDRDLFDALWPLTSGRRVHKRRYLVRERAHSSGRSMSSSTGLSRSPKSSLPIPMTRRSRRRGSHRTSTAR